MSNTTKPRPTAFAVARTAYIRHPYAWHWQPAPRVNPVRVKQAPRINMLVLGLGLITALAMAGGIATCAALIYRLLSYPA